MLKERENNEVCSFLVLEAIGTWFVIKISSCYTMLKLNADVLVSFLSPYNEAWKTENPEYKTSINSKNATNE